MLRTIADLQDPNVRLRYRIQTFRESPNVMHAIYDIVCTTSGRSQSEIVRWTPLSRHKSTSL